MVQTVNHLQLVVGYDQGNASCNYGWNEIINTAYILKLMVS